MDVCPQGCPALGGAARADVRCGTLDEVGRYVFRRERIAHRFRPIYRMHPFAEEVGASDACWCI